LSAIDEIRHEVASLAGDEDGAQIIELLAHICLPYSEVAARILLAGLSRLSSCTWPRIGTGSHVVQTITQLAVGLIIRKGLWRSTMMHLTFLQMIYQL
jgi:hypothetical protein